MPIRRLFTIAEILGVITLFLVVLGMHAINTDTAALAQMSPTIKVWMFVLFVGILCSIPLSLVRIFGKNLHGGYRAIFGFLLIGIGSIVVYCIPEYFHTMITLPVYFWYKVSVFSLPAICIDGGLFTLFTELYDSHKGLTLREQRFLGAGFISYTILAITVNFVVVLRIWDVAHQILFYQVLVLFVILLFVAIILKKSKG